MVRWVILFYMNKNKRHWFGRAGWSWAAILLFIILIVFNFYRIDSASHSVSDTLRPFLFETGVLGLVLFTFYRINGKIKKPGTNT